MSNKTSEIHIIWSNRNLDFDEWKDHLQEIYPNMNEQELMDKMYEINAGYLDDERENLNIKLSQPILLIADVGRWNGRSSAYAEIKSGNISDCLYSEMDMCEWYVDEYGDFRADAIHHDGVNHYLYRVYKDCATITQIESLKDKLYNNKATRADITRITRRIGDDIAKIYGFTIPKIRETQQKVR